MLLNNNNNTNTNNNNYYYYYIYGVGRVYVLLGGQGARARVLLTLCECIWNAVSLVLLAVHDTGSLGNPQPREVYSPGFTLGDGLPFPTFPYFYFSVFSCFSSSPDL